ncbi:13670_t:CDS:2 [Ambispora gerdemannii]|uniref:13670_t:CDS:1 n=1 Tax=Ambispora gerdemannii TaxID=144530 RepID=A0A9N9DDG6_9GLOM|nr:13670_t:CDS:2 [Ambispora gerdemannii]
MNSSSSLCSSASLSSSPFLSFPLFNTSQQQQNQWKEFTRLLSNQLYSRGFDLVKAFPAQRYNAKILSNISPLPTYKRNSTLAFVIANTKHLWSYFLRNLYNQSQMHHNPWNNNPLDLYTKQSVAESVNEVLGIIDQRDVKCDIRHAFEMEKSRFVAFQLLAHESGLAYYNRTCGLNVHEIAGPWIGLRSVVTLDLEGPSISDTTIPLENPYPEGDSLLKAKLFSILHQKNFTSSNKEKEKSTANGISRDWYQWVELRDLASGFMTEEAQIKWRYSEEQLEYHYTKNLSRLQEVVNMSKNDDKTHS